MYGTPLIVAALIIVAAWYVAGRLRERRRRNFCTIAAFVGLHLIVQPGRRLLLPVVWLPLLHSCLRARLPSRWDPATISVRSACLPHQCCHACLSCPIRPGRHPLTWPAKRMTME
jgi:hypothetical protein